MSIFTVTPLNIRLLGAHQPLSAGKRYDLLCQSAGSRPHAAITWWRDGQRLEKTTETVNFCLVRKIIRVECFIFMLLLLLFLYCVVLHIIPPHIFIFRLSFYLQKANKGETISASRK